MDGNALNEVFVLKEGYSFSTTSGHLKADGTISLVKGRHKNILFDTGLPMDSNNIIQGLADHKLRLNDINVVVCSHGHSDHVGNIGLFPQALLVVGCDVCLGDHYLENSLRDGKPFVIDEDISVIPTPGHTGSDVSLLVPNTTYGTVVLCGDLFEREADIEDASVWQSNSENIALQIASRLSAIAVASVIIPGHGPMFVVTDKHRKLLAEAEHTLANPTSVSV